MLNAESAMRRANEISKLGLGKSAPNPIVGAVIIGDDGQIISEGFHHSQGGGAHAEVVALSKAGQRARGATLFVTLTAKTTFFIPAATIASVQGGVFPI